MGNVIGTLIVFGQPSKRRVATWMSLTIAMGWTGLLADHPMGVRTPASGTLNAATDQGRSAGERPPEQRRRAAPTVSSKAQISIASGAPQSSSSRVRRLPPVQAADGPFTPTGQRKMVRPVVNALPTTAQVTVPGGGHQRTRFVEGRQQLDIAYANLQRGALASAEASAWSAIEAFADAADQSTRQRPYSSAGNYRRHNYRRQLDLGRVALREAEDFAPQWHLDRSMITVRRRSHQTVVDVVPDEPVAAAWVDVYLDVSRRYLIPLATISIDAAESLDLLATISLRRQTPGSLSVAQSLCLRRAALAGQPGNGALASALANQLADAGLREEAFGVRQYATRLNSPVRPSGPSSSPKQMRFEQLSPSAFASVSQDVMGIAPSNESATATQTQQIRPSRPMTSSVQTVGYRIQDASAQSAAERSPVGDGKSNSAIVQPQLSDASEVEVQSSILSNIRSTLRWPSMLGGRRR